MRMREFSYDPFPLIGREKCNQVGARTCPRQRKRDYRASIGSGRARVTRKDGKPVTSGDIQTMVRLKLTQKLAI